MPRVVAAAKASLVRTLIRGFELRHAGHHREHHPKLVVASMSGKSQKTKPHPVLLCFVGELQDEAGITSRRSILATAMTAFSVRA